MGILVEIMVWGSVVFAVAGVVVICWRILSECENWRRSAGRSAFWPLIH